LPTHQTHPEDVLLNLEYSRKQAKALLRTSLAGDVSALQRLLRYSSRLNQLGNSENVEWPGRSLPHVHGDRNRADIAGAARRRRSTLA
jgi:hypothetical protein